MRTVSRMAGAAILGITFGIEIESMEDPYIVIAEKALHSIASVGNVGAYMSEYLLNHALPEVVVVTYNPYSRLHTVA